MTLPVRHHERVEQALEADYSWWAKHRSQEQAALWFNGFVDALERLGTHPKRWPLAPESDDFPFEVRELHYGLGEKPTHRALYTIRPDMVYVLLIRHLAQRRVTPDDVDL